MELFTFGLFCAVLVTCLALGIPIVLALLAGLAIFWVYGRKRGFGWDELLKMSASGVAAARQILLTFLLIGVLTAMWRASGCIPTVITYASRMIRPEIFVLLTFLLNAGVSFLMGTSIGTAATMGAICLSMAQSMGMPLFWVGGAMLSGIYFGDRCSPVSTSALLVSTLTQTDLYRNIRHMFQVAIVPFFAACAVYLWVGVSAGVRAPMMPVEDLFAQGFHLHPVCLIPALAVPLLALFHLGVKQVMGVSILFSLPIALFVQHQSAADLVRSALLGYHTAVSALAPIIDGGGLLSVLRVIAIVFLSSCYSGIFRETGLLNFMTKGIDRLGARIGTYRTMLAVSFPISAIACNQTLAIMLVDQLTRHLEADAEQRAINLEDSAVLIPACIPWSIAAAVPLASTGAPLYSILGAVYLFFIPLWRSLGKGNLSSGVNTVGKNR